MNEFANIEVEEEIDDLMVTATTRWVGESRLLLVSVDLLVNSFLPLVAWENQTLKICGFVVELVGVHDANTFIVKRRDEPGIDGDMRVIRFPKLERGHDG